MAAVLAQKPVPIALDMVVEAPSLKRPAVAMQEDGVKERRAPKRRAAKACRTCRSRKVRCNVVEHGAPCTNCRLDEVDCVVLESKRKRNIALRFEEGSASPHLDAHATPESQTTTPLNVACTEHHVTRDYSAPPAAPSHASRSCPAPSKPGALALPNYVKPIPRKLGASECDFLQCKGAFHLPGPGAIDALCHAYSSYVYPLCPVVEVASTLATLQGTSSAAKLSLLVMQAVLYAGSAHVDLSVLHDAGYTTRKEARSALFAKVRLLYDFDYDVDCTAQLQALLLMSSWTERTDDRKSSWHWLGVATSLALGAAYDRDPAAQGFDAREQFARRQLWWSLVIQDRLQAMELGRLPRIRLEHSDVAGLQTSFSDQICIDSVSDTNLEKASLDMIFDALSTLAAPLGELLTAQHSATTRSHNNAHLELDTAQNYASCFAALGFWARRNPGDLSLNGLRKPTDSLCLDSPAAMVAASTVRLVFGAALLLLPPETFQESPGKGNGLLRTIASGIARDAHYFISQDQVHLLPPSSVTSFFLGLQDATKLLAHPEQVVREYALNDFSHCYMALVKLCESYGPAENALNAADLAVRKANIFTAGDCIVAHSEQPGDAGRIESARDIYAVFQRVHGLAAGGMDSALLTPVSTSGPSPGGFGPGFGHGLGLSACNDAYMLDESYFSFVPTQPYVKQENHWLPTNGSVDHSTFDAHPHGGAHEHAGHGQPFFAGWMHDDNAAANGFLRAAEVPPQMGIGTPTSGTTDSSSTDLSIDDVLDLD